jgi:methanogenic corrinoid protein MtbC1
VLDRLAENASSPFATANLVVATPTGQVHEFGALLVAATAAAEGWRVTYLGPDLPAEDIAEGAIRTRARAVAVSIVYPSGGLAVDDELRRLRSALPKDITVLLGGAGAAAYGPSIEEIGAVRLTSLEDLRAMLRTLRRSRRRPAA